MILNVKNIIKNYVSGNETLNILRGVDLQIEEGYSVAISGESGSGKSTLLNIIGALDKADSGSVFIQDTDITKLPEKGMSLYRSQKIGFIFQFHYLLKDFTALENVMLPAYIAGNKKKEAIEIAEILLQDVNLYERKEHFPSELSGGERQRVAVARSMVNDPALILADEPTGNLDPKNSEMVSRILYESAQKRNKTLIVVTHDKKIAELSDYKYVLENGRLLKEDNLH